MSSTEPTQPAGDEVPREVTSRDSVRVRRAPRYPRFIILGAGLGVIATFVATMLFPIDESIGASRIFGFLLLFGVTAGVVLGSLVAIILDRIATRRAKQLDAEHTTVDAADTPIEGELEE